MPDEHQTNLNQENRAVEAYLQWITNKVVPAVPNAAARIEALDTRIAGEPKLYQKAKLIAERHRLANPQFNADDLVEAFVKHCGSFSDRNGIDYAVWREMGVQANVLERAGMKSQAPAVKRAPTSPPRTRNKLTPEFVREFLAYVDEHGPDAAAEHYDYQPNYVTQAVREWPKKLEQA